MANVVAQAGMFLEEQLKIVDPNVIQTQYPEYWGYLGRYHKVVGGLPFGAKEIVTLRTDYVGRAANYGGKGTDIPLATLGLDTDKNKTLAGALGVEWTTDELLTQQAAQSTGMVETVIDVVTEYNKALQKGIKEWVHYKTLFGDVATGFTGLFNNSNVETIVLTDNLYSLSSADLHLYMKSLIKNFKKNAKLTAVATDLLTNSDLFDKLTNPITGNNSTAGSATPFELLTDPKKGTNLNQISEVNELTYQTLVDFGRISSGQNYDMFMLYESSEETLDKKTSTQILTPPEYSKLTYTRFSMIKISEVRVKIPYKVKYYLYPKAS